MDSTHLPRIADRTSHPSSLGSFVNLNSAAKSRANSRHGIREQDPRANAVKHGLSATTLLSKVVQREKLEKLIADLRAEYKPKGISEELLIAEIARHAAALDITTEAEPAVMRQAMEAIEQVTVADEAIKEDHRLATAVASDALDRCARYRRGHEKALHQALDKLRQFRMEPKTQPQDKLTNPNQFATTESCVLYLRRRLITESWRCPNCGSSSGHWLSNRSMWECSSCGKQVGVRFGTVFEHSPLSLTVWFKAIRLYAGAVDISALSLGRQIGVNRLGTCRTILDRIRQAVASQNLERGLAGLLAFPLLLGDP